MKYLSPSTDVQKADSLAGLSSNWTVSELYLLRTGKADAAGAACRRNLGVAQNHWNGSDRVSGLLECALGAECAECAYCSVQSAGQQCRHGAAEGRRERGDGGSQAQEMESGWSVSGCNWTVKMCKSVRHEGELYEHES